MKKIVTQRVSSLLSYYWDGNPIIGPIIDLDRSTNFPVKVELLFLRRWRRGQECDFPSDNIGF